MAQKSVKVDFSRAEGIPLFKKFAMFDSGLVPLSRYERDAHLFQRCKIPSLRIDLFIGDRSMELGNMADGTAENVEYHWNASDRLVEELQKNGVSPYYSWCYVPLPVQPEGGSFCSVSTGKNTKRLCGNLPAITENKALLWDIRKSITNLLIRALFLTGG